MTAVWLAVLVGAGGLAKPTSSPARGIPAPRPLDLVSLEATPGRVELRGPRAERQLLVTGVLKDGQRVDVTPLVRYQSSFPAAMEVGADGRVTAKRDGLAVVKISAGDLTTAVRVAISGADRDVPYSFRYEVIPALTRAGCNQGACHGSAQGKGGFRLSLLGYDPEADFRSIVKDAAGRRVRTFSPEDSLLLRKAVLQVPHAGGMRFKPDSHEYQILAGWLSYGAPGLRGDEPTLQRVEVFPPVSRRSAFTKELAVRVPVAGRTELWKVPATQRLAAVAHLSDGTVLDVTRTALITGLNDAVSAVTTAPEQITFQLPGQTAAIVRYGGLAAVSRTIAPYGNPAHPISAGFQPAGKIDELVAKKWDEMGLRPSGRSTDAEFFRRVHLDVLGTLPKPEETQAFLSSTDPMKRQKVIDSVLDRPEYADYWTLKWGDLLRNHRDKLGEKGMWSFHNWLRTAFRTNLPLDQFAAQLITAQGSTYTNGPANYFRVATNPADQAENTSQVFLGIRLACARCHQHPFEKWTQDDYWHMAAFFSRVGNKGSQEFGLFGGEQVVRVNPGGEVSNPRSGRRMEPKPLDGPIVDDPIDRRRGLAAWLADRSNPFFARNLVNRYWSYLMGRGIVDPVDDQRVTNPPSNPELLEYLAGRLVQANFNIKELLREILNSSVYQLSSLATKENRGDEVFYTKYQVKRMGAEELLDAVQMVTGAPEKFTNLPAGYRAIQLPDPGVQHAFLETFGRPERQIACECERSVEPNMAQALHLMNSDFIQNKIASGSGRLATLIAAKKPDAEVVEQLYLAAFTRPPTPAEQQKAAELIKAAPGRQEGLEDLLWALLNSREFLLKH